MLFFGDSEIFGNVSKPILSFRAVFQPVRQVEQSIHKPLRVVASHDLSCSRSFSCILLTANDSPIFVNFNSPELTHFLILSVVLIRSEQQGPRRWVRVFDKRSSHLF